jgi:multidrug efflux pump subunit AcrA (membrane-fusion protein)
MRSFRSSIGRQSDRGAEAAGGEAAESESESEAELPSTPVLLTSSTRRLVRVELKASQQSVAHRGQAVEVVLPGGAEVPGEVVGLAAVEAAAGEGNPEEAVAAVEAAISVTGKNRIPALNGATVSVRFTRQIRKQVLSVPLTALVAIGTDRFAVYVREGRARRQIVVRPGLGADGYVEVEGKGLREGMTVETGE